MRPHPHEFIRRFLMHVLPTGFHRIRHYGLFANANRAENIATARALLHIVPPADPQEQPDITPDALRCAALPVPTLRRPHDRDRGVRARLRAKLAPDAEQGRHVMTQAYCESRDFPVPMRWLYAGSDLSRPENGDQCAERPLMRSERLPRCPLQAPHLACPHIPVASLRGGSPIGVPRTSLHRTAAPTLPSPPPASRVPQDTNQHAMRIKQR